MQYRKLVNGDLWHWYYLCSRWPMVDFEESEHPIVGRLCEECKSFEHLERDRRHGDHEPRGSWE